MFIKIIMYLMFGVIGLLILISIIWRFYSQRATFPCPVWLGWLLELENPFTTANRAKVIIENLNLTSGMKVLDGGCGPGRLTIPIAQKIGSQGEVVAMDIQRGMLDRVQEKAKANDLHNIRFLNAGIGEGKLSHDEFDRALLVTVLGEIPQQKKALQELFSALKPRGILSVTEVIFDPHFQRSETVLRLAKSIGFQQKNIIGNRFAYTIQLEKPAFGAEE